MTEKPFFEVFPTCELKSNLEILFQEVTVRRVTRNTNNTVFKVFVFSHHIIQHKEIRRVEAELSKQLFPGRGITFQIFETYELSGQYTAESLLSVYKDSIHQELKEYNPILFHLFHHAEIAYPEEKRMVLTLEDTIVSRNMTEELQSVLNRIINERCGIGADIRILYKEERKDSETTSKAAANAELRVQQEIAAIVNRVNGNTEDGSESKGDENADKEVQITGTTKSAPKENKPSFQKGSFQKGNFQRGSSYGKFKKSDNPDVVYGRDFDDTGYLPINQIVEEMGEVVVRGKVIHYEPRAISNERTIVIFDLTDYTDTITVKLFMHDEQLEDISDTIKEGAFLKIKGMTILDKYDHEITIGSIVGVKKIPDFTVERMDVNPEKRVELHCHTKMSDMDGVSDVSAIIKRAKKWGHQALAVTDHGVVQAFTEANHTLDKGDPFKIIYGVEGYLVDDLKETVTNSKGQSLDETFVVFDLETTGFSAIKNRIIEIGAVKVVNGKITERFSSFVNPKVPIPFRIEKLTGINDSMVMDAETIEEILPRFLEFASDSVMVAHNAGFDMSFIQKNAEDIGEEIDYTVVDTVEMSRILVPEISKYTLDSVAKALNVSLENHHRAVDDAEATAEIFIKLCKRLREEGIVNLDGINQMGAVSKEAIRKMKSYHVIILAKNEIGRVNLYRLISLSHLDYFQRAPKIPKSVLNQYREGLIVGSACEAGELFQAIIQEKPAHEIARIVGFYDYLEIQPVGNNEFMIRDDKYEVSTIEGLRDYNRRIVQLGEEFQKPVVATCDVHFLDPEDEVYRRIIMAGKGFSDADEQAPLFLRTTDEMLQEFEYLGSDKAREVVITNTNLIADMIDKITPVRPDKCPPVIENSDQTLTDICYKKAKELYGEELPAPVDERLKKELHSIITNGFAVMYIIAQKLVWKSNEDGYLVGSRGSVGSSFVAYTAGITEVNSLAPHYYCMECHYSDFDSEEVRAYAGRAGCDMPDKVCPKCGAKLKKDGFDIPFETFLGFKGDKEPDIDLNFSGDYQSKAHKYTEVIFGAGQTFRAGTIGTLAEKTAYGYIKNYYEERGQHKRPCEINRIVTGCTGVRRTSGQHPGGIIVLPHGEEIYSFTPVQHPANDMKTSIVTTHFDYHSIDHNLLKLDILGHDDPTMIRMLQDITGIDPQSIALDDKDVMSLFQGTEVLGISPKDIGGTPTGSLGIPEFGTDFVIQMLLDTKPQSFSDLVRISGLSHGTDVWLGNAQTLIEEGKATISTAICTRDDIMTYLIGMGIEPSLAFTTMESVRKGKGLKPEMVEAMHEHQVPQWYEDSCRKIKYMFPKAHAAAYVMMAWRIAYCKINYPLAYYATYFSIRATAFSYELMCQGREKLEYYMDDYRKRSDTLSPKEQDTLKDMRIVQEMYARGFEFLPIDLTVVDAKYFQVIGDKIMPSLSSIDGMAENAADAVVEATKKGPYLSKDDFKERTKASSNVIDKMAELGLLGDIPESNQLSLFDF